MISVVSRFFEIAARFPLRPAILLPGQPDVTYAELVSRVEGFRLGIRQLGVGPGEVVGVAMKEPGEWVPCLLAVLAEGALYTALDLQLPAIRIQFMIRDSTARWILADAANHPAAKELAPSGCEAVILDSSSQTGVETPGSVSAGNGLAYITYTSGSTGMPKGVVLGHENILHEVDVHTSALGLTEEDRFTCLYPPSTVGCTRDLYGALLNGAALAFFPFREAGMAALRDWIRCQRLTQYHSVPPIFRELMRTMEPEGFLPSLRTVFLAGDRVVWDDVDLQRRHTSTGCRFYTGLGTSETSSLYSHWFVDSSLAVRQATLPSGVAIPGVTIDLLDENGERVPLGEVGQISVRSRYLAAGYWRREELTAASFLGGHPSRERCYRTGDYASLDGEGRLLFAGRRDQQVKILGQRIDLAEIDLQLRSLPGAREVAVRVLDSQSTTPRLVGYVAWSGAPLLEGEARQRLSERLPTAAVPTHLIWLARFPHAANGKIDYKQLPEPAADQDVNGVGWQARTEIDKELEAIWRKLFPVWNPGLADATFAGLGGHSLRAVELNLRLQEKWGGMVSGAELAEGISLRSLAEKVAAWPKIPKPAGSRIAWETSAEDRARIAAMVGTWKVPSSADRLAGGHAIRIAGPNGRPPIVWLPLMREDLDLVVEAASGQTVYLMPSGLFIVPKDPDSLGAWLRDLCRILEAEGVRAIRCGGFCAGGLAAVLFAKEFRGRGGTVEELVIVDAYGSEWARWLGRKVFGKLRFRSRFRAGWDRLRGRSPEPSRESGPVESPLDFDRVPYDGPTVLAMASQNRSRRWIIPRWGWTDSSHRAWRIVELPGTHLGIFEPPTRRQLLELLWGNKSD